MLDALAAATTPLVVAELPTAREVYGVDFARFGELTTDDDLDDWVRSRLDDLASRGRRAGDLVDGTSLGHGDLRADNMLVQPDGRVRIVDWPHACRSAPWVDGVLLAVNVEVLGGLRDREGETIDHLPLLSASAATRGASHDDVLDVLVGMLAYYTWASHQPEVPGLPTLRRDQGIAEKATLCVVQRLWLTSS